MKNITTAQVARAQPHTGASYPSKKRATTRRTPIQATGWHRRRQCKPGCRRHDPNGCSNPTGCFDKSTLDHGAPAPVTPEEATFKVLAGEKERMRAMVCGITSDSGDECLQKWFRHLSTKHQDDISKSQIIAKAVNASWVLDDAEVPL